MKKLALLILVAFSLIACDRYPITQKAIEFREIVDGELEVSCYVSTRVKDASVGEYGETFFNIYKYRLTCDEVPSERERQMRLAVAAREIYMEKYADLKECEHVD